MSTCGVCGERLAPGMGHACTSIAPRIPTLKTWRQLEQMAAEQHLYLFRTPGCVTVEVPPGRVPYVTITTDQIDSDENADRVVRAALAGALKELRRCES